MQENDGCTYLIVMQGAEQAAPRFLPKLPPNARFVHHANECFDIGTVGWVLNTHLSEAQLQQYDYFIWLNPSVRGPFMPAYLRGSMHWTEPLLSKLRDDVKLVGPTISCEHATIGPAVNKAHVQTYVVATDREGMAVLRRSGTVFNCWGSLDEVIQHSEVGTSQVIFAAGWSIDSLMLRYQVSGGAGAAWALAVKPLLRIMLCRHLPLEVPAAHLASERCLPTPACRVWTGGIPYCRPHATAARTLSGTEATMALQLTRWRPCGPRQAQPPQETLPSLPSREQGGGRGVPLILLHVHKPRLINAEPWLPAVRCTTAPQVKSPFRQAGWQATVAAVKYSEWARQSDAVMRRIAAGLPLNQDQLASLAQHPSSQPTAA